MRRDSQTIAMLKKIMYKRCIFYKTIIKISISYYNIYLINDYIYILYFITYFYSLYRFTTCFCRPKIVCPKMVSERSAAYVLLLLYIILFLVGCQICDGFTFYETARSRAPPSPPRRRSYIIIIIYRERPIGRTVHDMVGVHVCVRERERDYNTI